MTTTTYKQTNKERGKRLLSLRKHLRLSRDAFEAQAAISSRNLQNWETGRSSITETNLNALLTYYQSQGIACTPEWVLYGIGDNPLDAFKPQSPHHDPITEKQLIQQELTLFHQHHPHAIDMIITDDRMRPALYPQDLVAGVQCFGDDIKKLYGEYCIVKTIDKGLLVGRLEKGNNAHKHALIHLYPTESTAFKINDIVSAAKIIWNRRSG